MVVGILRLDFQVIAHSLKEKRKVARRMIDRLRSRYSVSVAEVDHQDLWQRLAIGVTHVGIKETDVKRRLDKVVDFLEEMHIAELIDRQQDVVVYSAEYGAAGASGFTGADDDAY